MFHKVKANPRCESGLVAFAILASVFCGCSRPAKVDASANAPVVPVVSVARHDLANTLEIPSEFQPYQEIEAYPQVSGSIHKLYADWGTHVKESQPHASL